MEFNKARLLIKQGYGYKEVPEMTGITITQFYQLKREIETEDFGCVVCGSKKYKSYLFCNRHRYRYIYSEKRKNNVKAA